MSECGRRGGSSRGTPFPGTPPFPGPAGPPACLPSFLPPLQQHNTAPLCSGSGSGSRAGASTCQAPRCPFTSSPRFIRVHPQPLLPGAASPEPAPASPPLDRRAHVTPTASGQRVSGSGLDQSQRERAHLTAATSLPPEVNSG